MRNRIDKNILLSGNPELEKSREYWIERLSKNIDSIELPEYYKDDSINDVYKSLHFIIDTKTAQRLIEASNKSDQRLFLILLAGFQCLIYKYSGCKDLLVSVPIYKQNKAGTYINTILPILTAVSGELKFKELVSNNKEAVSEAYTYGNYPIEYIAEELGIQVQNLLTRTVLMENIHGSLKIGEIKSDLLLSFSRQENTIRGEITFCAEKFRPERVEAMIEHLKIILCEGIQNVMSKISDINMLQSSERSLLIESLNQTSVAFPKDKTFHQLFEEIALQYPTRIAVKQEERYLCYGALNSKSNQLAHTIRDLGTKRESSVAILCHRSIEMLIGIIGIFKAGGVYIPLDLSYPPERIITILKESGTRLILTLNEELLNYEDSFQEILRSIDNITIVCLDSYTPSESQSKLPVVDCKKIENYPDYNINHINGPQDLCYIIYTSGSTGKPKGVMVEHVGMLNHLFAKINEIKADQNTVIVQNSSQCFDISVWQFLAALLVGGRTVIYPNETIMIPDRFIVSLKAEQVSVLEVVPSYMSVIIEYMESMPADSRLIPTLEYLFVTGEVLQPSLVKKWFSIYPSKIKIVNAYGPTEASDDITHFVLEKAIDYRSIPIGKPLQNFNIYIVDQDLNLCPHGVKGEICVSGIGVGRGYLRDDEKTKKAFMEDPFKKGNRLYKTGDIGRYLPDNNIEFYGRKDKQVKIRGFRIEIGEIENRLISHEYIIEAVVVDRKDSQGNVYLACYYTSSRELESFELKKFLGEQLPAYMIPDYLIPLSVLSKTISGKIDRKVLPDPLSVILSSPNTEVKSEVETKLEILWKEILEVSSVNREDDFFEMGGHSLKATLLLAKIKKEFKVDITIKDIFSSPTLAQMAKLLIKDSGNLNIIDIQKYDKREYYPVSASHIKMLLLQEMDPSNISFNITAIKKVYGKLDIQRVEQTICKLIERHAALRTYFDIVEGEFVQFIEENINFKLDYEEAEEQLAEKIIEDFIKPFDLRKAPLFRIKIVKMREELFLMLFDMHHIISDGHSMSIFTDNFSKIYSGEPLKEMRINYGDYSIWRQEFLQSKEFNEQEQYWLKVFETGVPALNIPTDYTRPSVLNMEGRTEEITIDIETAGLLKKFAKDNRVTIYMVLLAAYNILLSKYSNEEDIVVGSPLSGRNHEDLNQSIGMFINTVPLRNFPCGDKTLAKFIEEVKENTLKAFENSLYPVDLLEKKLDIHKEKGRSGLYDTIFVLQNTENPHGEININGLKFVTYPICNTTVKTDLHLMCYETEEGLRFLLDYSTNLFKQSTAQKMCSDLVTIIRQVVQQKDIKIKDIRLSHQINVLDQLTIDWDFDL